MSITHTKVSAVADGSNPAEVQPSDWNAVHTIGAATITTAMLVPSPVTPGAYTNANITVDVDGRVTAAANGTGGGGGGGITNTAPANTIMLSNGTNAVASGITDNASTVAIAARKLQVGATAVPSLNQAFFSLGGPTTTTQFYIQETDTNHVGQVGVNNEAICMVLDQRATFNTSADPVSASANGLTILVSSTRVAGTKPLINDGLIISVGGGDTNRAIYIPPGGGIISAGDGILSGPLTVAGDSAFSGGKLVATWTTGSSISLTGNITASGALTGGSAHITGNIKGDQEVIIDPSGTNGYLYIANAASGATVNNLNISSAGSGGKVIFQGNNVGSNSGTGGIEVWAGNNGGTAKGGITGAGVTWGAEVRAGTSATAGSRWTSGSVTPNSNVVGSVGDFYSWTGGGAATTLWVKESGAATNTGWVSK